MSQQIVLPIKDSNVLKMVQDTLLDSFRAWRRNYTIFQVGKATLLRVSDVMTLKKSDVYNPEGNVKNTAFIHDKALNIRCLLCLSFIMNKGRIFNISFGIIDI